MTCNFLPETRIIIKQGPFTLNIEAVCFSETCLPTCQSTWCHNPKDQNIDVELLSR
jgi:hypothetical protein